MPRVSYSLSLGSTQCQEEAFPKLRNAGMALTQMQKNHTFSFSLSVQLPNQDPAQLETYKNKGTSRHVV
jgi:hypothetical protein